MSLRQCPLQLDDQEERLGVAIEHLRLPYNGSRCTTLWQPSILHLAEGAFAIRTIIDLDRYPLEHPGRDDITALVECDLQRPSDKGSYLLGRLAFKP